MKTLAVGALSAALLASPLAVMAQTMDEGADQALRSFDDRWYIAPFAAYTWADEDRGTDDGVGFGLAVGKPINSWLNLELRATYTNLVGESSGQGAVGPGFANEGDFQVGDLALDGLFFLNRGAVQPFLLAGLGVISDDFSCDRSPANFATGCKNGSNKFSFMAEAGAGVLVPVSEYVSLRIDGRYRYDDNSADLRDASEFGDWIVTAGISIPIGARAAKPVTRTFELSADALFGFNKDTLSPTGVSTISGFARDLGDKANYTTVQVAGHTDPIGSDSFNQDLSDRRANTVRDQLVTDGVPSDRISAQGFGETRLKVTEADCAGASSRAALIECFQPNRRVEVTVEGMTAK
ncbi:MAG: OmpA family protein [Chromatiaceae bacterium]